MADWGCVLTKYLPHQIKLQNVCFWILIKSKVARLNIVDDNTFPRVGHKAYQTLCNKINYLTCLFELDYYRTWK